MKAIRDRDGLRADIEKTLLRELRSLDDATIKHLGAALARTVERRDLEVVTSVQHGIAADIEAELICCDAYEDRVNDDGPTQRSHAICYWAGAARGLALSFDPLGDHGKHRPDLHRIVNGKFDCIGDEYDPCHRYPSCDCTNWAEENTAHCDEATGHELPGHEPRGHDTCWLQAWFDSSDLDALYEIHVNVTDPTLFPNGPILVDFVGGHPEFRYVTDPERPVHRPADHWSWAAEGL